MEKAIRDKYRSLMGSEDFTEEELIERLDSINTEIWKMYTRTKILLGKLQGCDNCKHYINDECVSKTCGWELKEE